LLQVGKCHVDDELLDCRTSLPQTVSFGVCAAPRLLLESERINQLCVRGATLKVHKGSRLDLPQWVDDSRYWAFRTYAEAIADTLMLIEAPVGIPDLGEMRMWTSIVWDDEPAAF
jgi:hypothetical protein